MGVYKRFHGELMRHGRIRMEFHYTMGLLKNDAENRTATLDKIDKKSPVNLARHFYTIFGFIGANSTKKCSAM